MEANCPLCDRHCPAESPRCGRGRAYFSGEPVPQGRKRAEEQASEPNAVRLLRRIGHALHYADGSVDVLSGLSDEETRTLEALLERCAANLPAHHARERR